MDSGRTQYTFFWFIENYSCHGGKELNSPRFGARGLEDTCWYLRLNPNGFRDFRLSLHRSVDNGPESVSVHWEISVLGADGSPLSSMQYDQAFFTQYMAGGTTVRKFLRIRELVPSVKEDYLPRDTLSVRCKISQGTGSVLRDVGQCSARTRFRVEKVSFLHEVRGFSKLPSQVGKMIDIRPNSDGAGFLPNGMARVEVPSPSNAGLSISCSLFFAASPEKDVMIKIGPLGSEKILRKCKLYLLDSDGDATKCGRVQTRFHTIGLSLHTLPPTLTRKEILRRRSKFLPNDKLSLLCKCTLSTGVEFEKIEETVVEMPLAVKQKLVDAPTGNACGVAAKISACPSALDDLKSLYANNSFVDVELKTETKSFPAHKAVLCARSPVFGGMMSSDMTEKNTNSVFIDDLEDEVVEQFLLFLYSDTVESLEWTMATRLYYAADKYQVGRLKEVCSSFLLANLTPANAGGLLVLADTHSDAHLRKTAEEFILKNEEGVFGSRGWEKVMEANPALAMKTMHLKYKRRRLE